MVLDTNLRITSPATLPRTTIVITANGEVQTHEEAIVHVKELDIFLTMKVLENSSAVLSLGKLCDENGYSYEWINGQKPHLIKDGIRIICNTENFVPIVVPDLTSSSSTSSSSSRTPLKKRVILLLHPLHPHFLHLQWAKCRFEKEKMGITVTSLQCQCLSWVTVDHCNLVKPKSIKFQKQMKEFKENLVDDEFQYKEILTSVLLMKLL